MSFHDFIERAWAYGIKSKSRRKITAQQMYPWAVERQLQADLKAEFTKAGLFYKEQALKGTQSLKDNADDLLAAEFNNDERLRPLAERVAYEVEKFQQACFENFSEVVIGERYIPAVVGPSVTETWENNFLTLCRSTNDDLKKKVSEIISNAVMNGNNIADTAKQIDDAVGNFSYSKALTIARTETGKLNMAISKAQMEDAGIDKYEWSCMMDERSRPSHEKMDGKIGIWSNPNVVYNIKTKKTEPRPQSAVHLHPGDDYNCRCVALPWDELIEEVLNKKKGRPNNQWLELKEQEKQKQQAKSLERIRIKSIPFIGDKLSEMISKSNALTEFISASSSVEKNNPIKYSEIAKIDDSATPSEKIRAVNSDLIEAAKKYEWYNSKVGNLVLSVSDNLGKGVFARTQGLRNIEFSTETANHLFSGLKKIQAGNKTVLSAKEMNAVITLSHELNHLKDVHRIQLADFSVLQRSYLEICNEYITQHKIDEFLKQLGGLTFENSSLAHSEKVLILSDYYLGVKKIEAFVAKFNYNQYNVANLMRDAVDKVDIHSRDMALKGIFQDISNGTLSNNLLNRLVDMVVDNKTSFADFLATLNQ